MRHGLLHADTMTCNRFNSQTQDSGKFAKKCARFTRCVMQLEAPENAKPLNDQNMFQELCAWANATHFIGFLQAFVD